MNAPADSTQRLYQLGLSLYQRGDMAGAAAICTRVLNEAPRYFDALHLAGILASQSGDYPRALLLMGEALAVVPNTQAQGQLMSNRAIAYAGMGRHVEALADLDRALAAGARHAYVHYNRGTSLHGLRRLEDAIAAYDAAIAQMPGHTDALHQKGLALYELGRTAEAAAHFSKVLACEPNFAAAHNGLGLARHTLGELTAALESFDAATRFDPRFASPYINRGIVLRDLGRLEDALVSLDKAVELAPNNPNAHGNRSTVLTELKRPTEAMSNIQKALALNPHYPFLDGIRIHYRMYVCDWAGIEGEIEKMLAGIARGEPVSPCSPLLGITDSPALQRKAAEIWMNAKHPANPALGPLPKYPRRERIRLGYYSADFYRHATAHLVAELFERHDRTKFEVTAFSFGPATGDAMQQRLMAGCDKFIDVRDRSDREVAALSREMGIDIALDMKGITGGYRAGIFAHRAAPIQVNYLAYPSTMGVSYIDYLIADNTLITDANRPHFSERVVTLPHSYQANDSKREIAERVFTRTELGLPEQGFVFCSFNNNYKIMPAMFDIWMRILKAVAGSVLWLIEDSPVAAANLRAEATKRGVDAARLVFAGRVAPDLHLARQRAADLFLDTLPCNAHTTASDALWADLPVLTCPGETFTARVAASLLNAVGLPELIAPDLKAYEAEAIALAQDPQRLRALKDKLIRQRPTAPLFDSHMYARDIEALYIRMVEDYQAGEAQNPGFRN